MPRRGGTPAIGGVPLTAGREPLPSRVRDAPPLPDAYREAVGDGLRELRLDLGPDQLEAIEGHARLLLAWTGAINLTAVRDPFAVGRVHVIDSLTALERLRADGVERLLDLGSGAGYPGIPLAAAIRSLEVTLLEPVGKKARFLATAIEATGLAPRVSVMAARAEDLARDPGQRGSWPAITARAVASTAELIELGFPLLRFGGKLIAWKRGALDDELVAARRAIEGLGGGALEIHDVRVSDLAGHRLVIAQRRGPVPDAYPREPAARRRRPW